MERYAEVIFEDFMFANLAMVTPHAMTRLDCINKLQDNPKYSELVHSPCQMVVDSGFSYTYALPFFNGLPMKHASLRLDVGGKLLTNLFNEQISQKDFNL